MRAYFHLLREKKDQPEYGRIQNKEIKVDLHFHSQIELYIIISGQVDVLINEKHKTLGAGEIAVSLSNDTHGYRASSAADVIYLVIPTRLLGDLAQSVENKYASSPFINDKSIFDKVLDAANKVIDTSNELLRRGYLYLVLGTVLENIGLKEVDEDHSAHSDAKLLIYVSENFKKELSLSHLSEKFGYNPSYISGYFKKAFGVSFSKYLSTLRLREAIRLFETGEYNVTESALESGFGSTRSFYRAFCEEFHCSPKEYFKK